MIKPFIYLASQSARRRDLLEEMDIPYEVIPSTYAELPQPDLNTEDLVHTHALGKARQAVLPKTESGTLDNSFILGADTVVIFENQCLGKPKDYEQAIEWLLKMSGRKNKVLTGLTLIHCRSGEEKYSLEKTTVTFKKWNSNQIEKYAHQINALDKAGAYAIQVEPCIVSSYEGSYSNVIGLPKERLLKMLKEFSDYFNARQ